MVSVFGLVWLMARMYKLGKLTENFFVILILTYISLFLLTLFILVPPTDLDIFIWAVITIIVWLIGYPFGRWIFRQLLPPK